MINKVLFLGSKELGLSVLRKIYNLNEKSFDGIVTFDDSTDKRSYLKHYVNFASTNKIDINIIKKPSQLKDIIERKKPELVIVVGWYWIIKDELLSKVKNGFIGIHGSLLPKYRGFAPFVWALINGEVKTGLSLFYFTKGIDTGDIIAQKEIVIDANTNIKSLLISAEKKSIELIEENYISILNRKNSRVCQSKSEISYCSVRKPEDGIINWNDSFINIHNFIRAQSDPYPGAFSYINDKKYYFLKSQTVKDTYYGVPGIIAKKNKDSVIICCKEGAIEVSDIRIEDKQENVIRSLGFGKKFTIKA